jgi:hypothetical protein
MLKHKIKYTNLDGEEVEGTFYFNLSKLDLMEMEMSGQGGSFNDWIQRVILAKDQNTLIREFKKMILTAYGERSEDGTAFLKKDLITGAPLSRKFEQHPAFEQMFLDIASDNELALAFVRGIIPADLQGKFEEGAKEVAEKATAPSGDRPPGSR